MRRDLAELVRLKSAIAPIARPSARNSRPSIAEQERLAALMDARQGRLAEVERDVGAERGHGRRTRPAQAGTLKELIDRMEKEIAGARAPPRRPGEADARRRRKRNARAIRAGRLPGSGPACPEDRLLRGEACCRGRSAAIRCADSGPPDGYGGTTRGISIATRPKRRRGIPGGRLGGFRRAFPILSANS